MKLSLSEILKLNCTGYASEGNSRVALVFRYDNRNSYYICTVEVPKQDVLKQKGNEIEFSANVLNKDIFIGSKSELNREIERRILEGAAVAELTGKFKKGTNLDYKIQACAAMYRLSQEYLEMERGESGFSE